MKVNYLFCRQAKTLPVRPASKEEIAILKKKNHRIALTNILIGSILALSAIIFPASIHPTNFIGNFLFILSVIGIVGTSGITAILNGIAVMEDFGSCYSKLDLQDMSVYRELDYLTARDKDVKDMIENCKNSPIGLLKMDLTKAKEMFLAKKSGTSLLEHREDILNPNLEKQWRIVSSPIINAR